MKMIDVVKTLRNEGHTVSYYVRKDGGILIKSIDGQRFTGATGNMYARAMSKTTLSTKRATQLSKITWEGKRAKSQIADREVKKQLEKVQRKWNKAFPHKRGESPAVGRKTAAKVKWTLEHKGKEETMRLLSEAERYAAGKAYSKNIEELARRVDEVALKLSAMGNEDTTVEPLYKLSQSIRDNAWMIDEDSIQPAYDSLYELNQGVNPHDVAVKTAAILKIPLEL